ncbi:DASS family sodium-coupled anion symporter [Wenzhouxiangella sp. AB-CW3]|uniref:SLC13 family permease n=1 Tax=Wenzhouxiangella sp. AB-CW3 TaxID=2771012 RepID=UPI00168B3620|nr:DASS family sodium-coupled anion symporter [Wenzhouxiangella sp. AB-CW3]QOC23933.1 DASS family sodium-coupled anion symporter [Wenzhouxiangella sp. AB-CW3]
MNETVETTTSLRPRIGLLAGPLLFAVMLLLPAPEGLSAEGWQVAAVATLMVCWWITEAIPIPATALLPIVLFPILGVTDIAGATTPFANPLIYLFMGGFIIALGMEKSGLHRRIALNIVHVVGTRPTSIILGFMMAAAFLSMWVSNTATTLMMLPIALSIIALVETDEAMEARHLETHFALVLLLGLAYACNIGGIATLIGTPPNALMAGYLLDNHGIEIGFAQWMMLGVPLVIVSLPILFLVLTRVLFPVRLKQLPGGRDIIREELRRAGAMTRAEKQVAVIFSLTALLWVTRPVLQSWIPGLSDTGIAIFGALLLFLVPLNWRRWTFVLDWNDAKRLPWEVLILFGGGLSLAAGITDSGLADWIGTAFHVLDGIGLLWLIMIALALTILLTEVTSNTATAAAFIPILASVAIAMGFDPMLLAVPSAIAASCAFMLPVATPPNAIVYGSGYVSIPRMARAGLVFNLLMIGVITVMLYLLMGLAFGVVIG